MRKKLPIFYSALLLTGVNLLLRFVGTSFQVYLSSRIGAEGIGLLQLVLSVGSMAMVAGMAGIRTATMYLTAAQIGRKQPQNVTWVLSGCILYSLICSGTVAALVYAFAPQIAALWIGNADTVGAVRMVAAFLPVNCLCGVMVGYFTGANRITTLAAVEVAEQLISIVCTMSLLTLWAGSDPARAYVSVVFGSALGACLTLSCLIILRLLEKPITGNRIPIARSLSDTAIPLALADDLRTGITTVENLMVPKRLALYPGILSPLAAFGTVCGMVFPVLMFPIAILFGLTEILVPELAQCHASESHVRIRYLVRRSLHLALLYGSLCGGILYLCAEPLCMRLYGSPEAARYLRWFAPLAVMLYCDAVTDAMIKGLGEQKASVRYNILTNSMDVILLFVLLPRFGIAGYFASFLVTHVINFGLSIRRLLKTGGVRFPLRIPLLAILAAAAAVWVAGFVPQALLRAGAYTAVLGALWYLTGAIHRSDVLWLRKLIHKK